MSAEPSQFMRSAMPSKGEADACTPLSPVLGGALRPSFSQSALIKPRIESAGACAGSVGPSTAPRKASHLRSAASHLTTNV